MSANKWALLTTALALAGLGFAAMSTNPPFNVPHWVPSAFFVAAGIAFLWLIILLIRGNISKRLKTEATTTPELIIGAKVVDNPLLSNSEKMGSSLPNYAGTLKTIDIALQIRRPIVVNALVLEIWGQQIETLEYAYLTKFPEHTTIRHSDSFKKGFYIPEQYTIDNSEAKIYVLANGIEYRSDSFPLKFGEVK